MDGIKFFCFGLIFIFLNVSVIGVDLLIPDRNTCNATVCIKHCLCFLGRGSCDSYL